MSPNTSGKYTMSNARQSIRKIILSICLILSVVCSAGPAEIIGGGGGGGSDQPDYREGYLLMRFAPSGGQYPTTAQKQTILNSELTGCTIVKEYSLVPGLTYVQLPAGADTVTSMLTLKSSPSISYVEMDWKVEPLRLPNDTRFNELWAMENTGQSGGTADADIDAPLAWDITTGNSSVIVAVTDTGVDYNHPDLAANIWNNTAEINGQAGVDDDGNGYIDDIHGYDFTENNDSDPMDDDGHGTHCAGTIGAVGNNNRGVTGVCWNAKIMAVRIIGGTQFINDSIEGIQYAVSNGAKAINASWRHFGGFSQSMYNAIQAAGNAGVLFVAAAANDSIDNDTNPYPNYPSSYNLDNIIAVMATGHTDQRASYSNWGKTTVDLAAPGGDMSIDPGILSTLPGNTYGNYQGTSMAAPHVTGAVALMYAANPSLTPATLKSILLNTVDKKAELKDLCVSGGRMNLYEAVRNAASDELPPTPNPAQWDIVPTATGTHTIYMRAVEAVDEREGEIRYNFVCVEDANLSSGWQLNNWYEPNDPNKILPGGTYTFKVQARDARYNATEFSDSNSATTSSPGDTLGPAPRPARWQTAPRQIGYQKIIAAQAMQSFDENGPVKYMFDCAENDSLDQDWSESDMYLKVLPSSTPYGTTYTITLHVKDANDNESNTASGTITLRQAPRVLEVPVPYITIQDAIDAAEPGDTIVIHPGIYGNSGSAWMDAKNRDLTIPAAKDGIRIMCDDPNNPAIVAATIIDCAGELNTIDPNGHSHRGFNLKEALTNATSIEGLTIRNGYIRNGGQDSTTPGTPGGNSGPSYGGGILCTGGASPVIKNCIINNCVVDASGGRGADGQTATEADPNGADGGNAGNALGGGLYADAASSPVLIDCKFFNCRAFAKGGDGGNGTDTSKYRGIGGSAANTIVGGGGIFYDGSTNAKVYNCTVTDCNVWESPNGNNGSVGTDDPNKTPTPLFDLNYPQIAIGAAIGLGPMSNNGEIKFCNFTDNIVWVDANNADYTYDPCSGGAVGIMSNSTVNISNTLIDRNISDFGGGGIRSHTAVTLTITDCDITNNVGFTEESINQVFHDLNGAGLYMDGSATLTITDSSFTGNTARSGDDKGGAVFVGDSAADNVITIHNSEFSNNTGGYGGGVCIFNAHPLIISSCEFSDNTGLYGGAIHVGDSNFVMTDSQLLGNNATGSTSATGGGVYALNSGVSIKDSLIEDNNSDGFGGGVHFRGTHPQYTTQELYNCIITNNLAAANGGGVGTAVDASPLIRFCTVADNTALNSGGGISCTNSFVQIVDSIVANNDATGMSKGDEIAVFAPFYLPSTILVQNSLVELGLPKIYFENAAATYLWSSSNVTADPIFTSTNVALNEYYLSQTAAGQTSQSPAVDKASVNADSTEAPAAVLGQDVNDMTTRTDFEPDTGKADLGYHYTAIPTGRKYSLELEVLGPEDGILRANWIERGVPKMAEAANDDPCTINIYAGTVVSLTVTTTASPYFINWTGTDNDTLMTLTNTATMNQDRDVKVRIRSEAAVTVPTEEDTIQAGIDAAFNGDTVYILPGVYTGDGNRDLDFKGKKIKLSSTNPTNPAVIAATIIDCQGSELDPHNAINFVSNEGLDSQVLGLTIRNGYIVGAYGPGGYPDPCFADGSDATGTGKGAGIFCDVNSSPTIMNCVIENCIVTGGYGGHGWGEEDSGGYWVDPANSNNAYRGGDGGNGYGNGYGAAMYFSTNCKPYIEKVKFINNRASGGIGGDGGDGGKSGELTTPGAENSGGDGGSGYGSGYGSAMYFDSDCEPVIVDCNFIGNVATSGLGGRAGDIGTGTPLSPVRARYGYYGTNNGEGYGGVIYAENGCKITIKNCPQIDDNGSYTEWWGWLPAYPYHSIDTTEISSIGGAFYINSNCDFDANNIVVSNSFGSAVYITDDANSVKISNSTISGTQSDLDGGGISIGDNCGSATFSNVTFLKNDTNGDGGGMHICSDANFTQCYFFNNTADGTGAAMRIDCNSLITLDFVSCNFSSNVSLNNGGAIYGDNCQLIFNDTFFIKNQAMHGGAFDMVNARLRLVDCVVQDNTAIATDSIGGGIFATNTAMSLEHTRLVNNQSKGTGGMGGAVGINNCRDITLFNCLLADNFADKFGGAVNCSLNSKALLINCTITKNHVSSSGFGGGIYTDWSSQADVFNSILSNNIRYAIWDDGTIRDVQLQYNLFFDNDPKQTENPVSGDYWDEDQNKAFGGPVDVGQEQSDINGKLVNLGAGRLAANNLYGNPGFVQGNLGEFYLDQSLTTAVDRGVDGNDLPIPFNIDFTGYTTDPAANPADDSKPVDLGYHYRSLSDSALNKATLTVTVIGGHGSVKPNSGVYFKNEIAELEAIPDSGWRIKYWKGTNDDSTKSRSNTVTMTADKTVEIVFEQAQYHYVGSNWEFHTIHEAINEAHDGDIIVVDEGIWDETDIIVRKAVVITSKNPDDPCCVAATIIQQTPGYVGKRFIFTSDATEGTELNGFTIRNSSWGIATASDGGVGENGGDGSSAAGGAIIFNSGSNVLVKNCVILNNYCEGGTGGKGGDADATHNAGRGGWAGRGMGGAVYMGTDSTTKFVNCQFIDNSTRGGNGGNGGNDANPGGEENYGGNWSRPYSYDYPPLVLGSIFREADLWQVWGYAGPPRWYSGYGGAAYIDRSAVATFENCLFTGNSVLRSMSGTGGNDLIGGENAEPAVAYSLPNYGGAVFCDAYSAAKFKNCIFTGNSTTTPDPNFHAMNPYLGHGGAIAAEGCAIFEVDKCTFTDNVATVGGALYFNAAAPRIVDCNFAGNTAIQGGAVAGTIGVAELVGCSITDNTAAYGLEDVNSGEVIYGEGGAVRTWQAEAYIADCEITGNTTDGSGGGVFIGGDDDPTVDGPAIVNCLITENTAARDGGGISSNWGAQLGIESCTIAGNTVESNIFPKSYGGGLFVGYSSAVDVFNSIIWGNYAEDNGSQIAVASGGVYNMRPSQVQARYSDIQGGSVPVAHPGTGGSVWTDLNCVYIFDPNNLSGTALSNPLFISNLTLGNYFLSQPDTGDANQTQLSPAVNAGLGVASDLPLGQYIYTTRTDSENDFNDIDMGFHHRKPDIYALGDINLDGYIDMSDLALIGLWWGSSCYFPDWCEGADLNHDGIVNFADETIITTRFNLDDMPPIPNPMSWLMPPQPSNDLPKWTVIMQASDAIDNTGLMVEYQFVGVTGASQVAGMTSDPSSKQFFRDWDPNSSWRITGLAASTEGDPETVYAFRVRARDINGNMTDWSPVGYFSAGAGATAPPAPTWQSVPAVSAPNTVSMTAAVAGYQGTLQYNFEETTGGIGATDSGWIASPTYVDSDLEPNNTYTYRVKVRDVSVPYLESQWSTSQSVTITETLVVDTTPPGLPAVLWVVQPINTGSSPYYHTMTINEFIETVSLPVQYKFECSNSTHTSGWITGVAGQTITYTTPNPVGYQYKQYYTWRVRARDAAGNETVSAWVSTVYP